MTTDRLNHAIALAAKAHAGQTDKAGQPYILHPLRVMLRMQTGDEMIVAVLHDIIEDCAMWSFDRLYDGEGFSFQQASAVDVLSRRKGQRYELYIAEVARDPLATRVKLADLEDNLDPARVAAAKLPRSQIARYEKARDTLRNAQGGARDG